MDSTFLEHLLRPPLQPEADSIRCEVVCCSVALSFSKLGGVQRERRRTLRIIFPYRAAEVKLKIRAGYDIAFNCIQEVPMLLMLSVHPSRQQDLLSDHVIRLSPNVEARDCLDAFGNVCTRLVAPPGLIELSNEFLISDSGFPDEINNHAEQWPVGGCQMKRCRTFLVAGIATRRSSRIRRGRCLVGSLAVGSEFRRSVTMFMTVLNSDTTTPDAIGLRPKGTRNASAFAATSRTWRSLFAVPSTFQPDTVPVISAISVCHAIQHQWISGLV